MGAGGGRGFWGLRGWGNILCDDDDMSATALEQKHQQTKTPLRKFDADDVSAAAVPGCFSVLRWGLPREVAPRGEWLRRRANGRGRGELLQFGKLDCDGTAMTRAPGRMEREAVGAVCRGCQRSIIYQMRRAVSRPGRRSRAKGDGRCRGTGSWVTRGRARALGQRLLLPLEKAGMWHVP